MGIITEDDLQKIEQYENDYSKLKQSMKSFMHKYRLQDLLSVIAEVFKEVN